MLSFKNRVVFLALVSCSASGLRNCGEFEKDEMIDEILREYSKPLPYQNVLDQLFQAYDEKDSNRMEEMYKHLEGTQTDESEEFDESLPIEYSEYAKKRIKFVVSLHLKKKNQVNLSIYVYFYRTFVARSHQSTRLSGRRPQNIDRRWIQTFITSFALRKKITTNG